MLESIITTLDAMKNDHNETETSLRGSHRVELAARTARRESLLGKQAELNATFKAEATTSAQVSMAITDLEERHQHLVQRATALRQFAAELGGTMQIPQV